MNTPDISTRTARSEVQRHAIQLAEELEQTAKEIRKEAASLDLDIRLNSPTRVVAQIMQDLDRKRNANAIVWQLVAALEYPES